MALTKKQLAHLEKRLLNERARALKALGLFDKMAKANRDSGDTDLAVYTDHMADQGTEAQEREKAASFATKEGWKRRCAGCTTTRRPSATATRAEQTLGSSGSMRCRMRATASTASARKSPPRSGRFPPAPTCSRSPRAAGHPARPYAIAACPASPRALRCCSGPRGRPRPAPRSPAMSLEPGRAHPLFGSALP